MQTETITDPSRRSWRGLRRQVGCEPVDDVLGDDRTGV